MNIKKLTIWTETEQVFKRNFKVFSHHDGRHWSTQWGRPWPNWLWKVRELESLQLTGNVSGFVQWYQVRFSFSPKMGVEIWTRSKSLCSIGSISVSGFSSTCGFSSRLLSTASLCFLPPIISISVAVLLFLLLSNFPASICTSFSHAFLSSRPDFLLRDFLQNCFCDSVFEVPHYMPMLFLIFQIIYYSNMLVPYQARVFIESAQFFILSQFLDAITLY